MLPRRSKDELEAIMAGAIAMAGEGEIATAGFDAPPVVGMSRTEFMSRYSDGLLGHGSSSHGPMMVGRRPGIYRGDIDEGHAHRFGAEAQTPQQAFREGMYVGAIGGAVAVTALVAAAQYLLDLPGPGRDKSRSRRRRGRK